MGFPSKTLLRTAIGLFLFISPLFVNAQRGHVTLDGNRYYFSEEKNTWENARKYCTGIGLDLISIDNEAEQNRISTHLSKVHKFLFVKTNWDYWLGAKSDAGTGLGFTWASTGAPLLYTKWLKQEPSRTGNTEGCVITTNHASSSSCVSKPCEGSWHSVACDKKYRYICEPVQNHASAGSSSFSQGVVDPDLSERIQPVSGTGTKGGGRLTQQTTIGQVSFTQKPDFQGTDQFSNQRPDANQNHLTQQTSGGNQRPDIDSSEFGFGQQNTHSTQKPDFQGTDQSRFSNQRPDTGSNQGIEQGFGQQNTHSTQKPDFQGTDQSRFSNQRPDTGSNQGIEQGFGQQNTHSTQKPGFQGTDQSRFTNQRPGVGSNQGIEQGFGQQNTHSTQKPGFQGTDQSRFTNQRPDTGSNQGIEQGFGQQNTHSTQKPGFQGTDQSRFTNQRPGVGSNQGIEQGFGQQNTHSTQKPGFQGTDQSRFTNQRPDAGGSNQVIDPFYGHLTTRATPNRPGSNNFGRITQGPSSQIQGSSGIETTERPDVEDFDPIIEYQQNSRWSNAKGGKPQQPIFHRPPK